MSESTSTLFCNTYDGSFVNYYSLFEKIIKKGDYETQQAVGFDGTAHILPYFLDEMADIRLQNGNTSFSKEQILNLKFWETYGLSSKKIPYLSALTRFGILVSYASQGKEYFYISYNLLEDTICAKRF